MSNGTAAGLQLAGDEVKVSPAMQSIYMQPGHTVWLFSAESLNLSGRHLPANLQNIKAFHLVACTDHYYLDVDPSEDSFNQAGDAKLDLVPILKTSFAVAEEIKTFARERGCVVLDALTDASVPQVKEVWNYLFANVPDDPTIPERIAALPQADANPAYASVVNAISEALNSALSWREFYMSSRLANLGPRGFSQQERLYFAEAGLQIPDEASANRAQDLAEVQGSAMGDSVGTAIGSAIAASQAQTASVFAEVVKELGSIIQPMQQQLAQLKEVVNAKGNDSEVGQSAENPEGAAANKTAKPAGNKPANAR